jgi:hypothetical protein
MAAAPNEELPPLAVGAAHGPSLSLLSLNTNRLRDLAGLAGLHSDLHPDIIFLQEVSLQPQALQAVAAALGLQALVSEAGIILQTKQIDFATFEINLS